MRRAVLLSLLVTAPSCGGGPDATPDGTVRELVRLLGEEGYDPAARKRAYELFDPGTRRDLARRAKAASESAGRSFEPSEMIVPGGTTFRFEVDRVRVVEERVDRAVVEVIGTERERARIRLVREGDGWRVVLPLAG